MLKLGKLRKNDSQATFERVSAGGSALAARLETTGLHAVAADLHVAPTSRVIFAGIEKEPATGVDRAGFYARGVGGEQDV